MPDRPSRVRPIALTASVALAVSLATCARESAGPPRHAAFSVAPVLPSGTSLAAFNLSVDNVRLIVVRPPADTVFDQTVAFPANQSSLPISADIPLEQSPETFQVTIQLLSGTTLLFAGTQSVSVTADQVTPPAQIPVTYSGPGQNVASLTIDPPDSVLTQGGTLQFRLTAKDAQGVIVPTFYASWTTSDTNAAKVDATGVLTAPFARATVSVLAHTPNNVSASTPSTFAPAATAISIVSGCNQGAPPGGQLPQPVVVRVIAGDQVGVKGVAVQFTAPPGGAVVPTQAVTDANGLAQTVVTLGSTPGPTSLSINAGGLAPVTCNQTVQTSATKLAITAQPTGSVTAGAPFTVVVTAQDALGNTDVSFAGSVTLALGANPGGAVFGPQTVTAVAGVATFGSVALDKAGTGYTLVATSGVLTPATSAPFTVVAGAATQLVFTTQPPATVVAGTGFPIVVTVQDGQGNAVTTFTGSITLALGTHPAGVVLTGTTTVAATAGVATFSSFPGLTVAGGYTLVASSSGLQSVVSNSFTVIPAAATTLAFTTQPSNVASGVGITPAVQVAVQDNFGNTVTTATDAITVSLTVPNGAVLGGTLTRNAASGVATFTGLTVDKAGTYTLSAVATGLTGATSASFTVTTGAATQLAITTQPTNVTAGVAIAPAVTVEARDAGGNLTSTFTGNVTVALQANPGTGLLSGTLTRAAVAGVATFDDLSLDKAANGYTLRVTSGALTAATSVTFNVSAGTATTLAFVTQPVSVLQGAPIAPPVAVAVQDGFGNTVPSAVNNITMSIGTNPNAGTLSGTLTVAASGGVATFSDLHIDNPGTGYTLQAAAGGFTAVVSAAFNVLPSGAGIAWINAAGGNWSNPANWSPARVPAKGDTVFIRLGGSYTVTLDVNDTVAFLTVGGGAPTLTASSRTLGVDSGGSVAAGATVPLTNGTLNGAGILVSQGTLNLQNTTVNSGLSNLGLLVARSGTTLNGPFTTGPVSTLRVEGDASCCSAAVTVANGFTNNGTIDLTAINGASGTSAVLTVTNGSLTNAAGAHLNSLPGTGGARTLTAQLANQGTLTVSQPLTINHGSAAHTNSGTVALAANLTLNQSGVSPSFTHSGTLTIQAGDTLILNSGAFNYAGGAIGGLGAITFSSVTLALTPNLTNDTLTLSFTNSTVNGPGTLANAATRTLFAQNTTFNGPVDNQGVLRARAGTTFNGSLTTSASSTLRVEGDASCCSAFVTVTNGFTNNGTIDLTAINGASGTSAALTVTNGSLTNAPGGHINSLPGTGGARTLTAQLVNQGTVTVSAPLTINHGSAAHTNSGTIALAASLTLNQSGVSPSFTHSGTLAIPAGDTLIVNSGAFDYTGGTIGGLGAITFSSATLSLTPALTNDTLALSFTNSTVNGPGTLANAATRTLFAQNTDFNGPVNNQGVLQARSGTTFNGSLTTSAASTLRVEGDAACCAAFVTVTNGFTNNGTIDLTAINGASGTSAALTVTNGSLTNATGAHINSLAGTGGSRTLTAQLVNLGTLAVSQPLTINHGSAAHTNSGTITVAANLTVNQSGITPSFTNGGAIGVGTGDTLTITSGAFTQNAGTLGGAGALALSSVNPAAFNTAHSLGSIILLNATVSFSTAQSTAATQWGITNSTVNGPITFTNNAGRSLTVQGATYNTAFDNQGALTLRASSSLTGTVTTGGASSLVVQGDAACCAAFATIANGFTNNGTIDLTAINGTSGTTAQLTVTSGTLTNAPGAIITSSAGTGGARTLAVALNNLGTLTVAQPLTMNLSAAVHTNGSTGVINITGGDLTLNQGGAGPSFTNLGTVNLPSGRTWTVTGGAWTHSGPALGSGGALVLSSVSPAAFNTAHTLGAITLTNTTASFALDQSTATTAFTLTNSTVNGPGTLTNAAGKNLFVQGGVLNTALINQNLVTLRGSVTINDTIITAPSSTLRIEGDAACCAAFVRVDSAFTNNGTIELTAVNGAGTTASLTVDSGIVVNAGTIDVLPGNGGARALNVSLNNQGTMIVSQALTMNKSAASVVNASTGAIQLAGGDLTVTLSGFRPAISNFGTINVGTNKMVVSGTGGFTNQSAGTLMGPGTLDVATPNISFITNGKTIVGAAPGMGILTFLGTYTVGPTASIEVELGQGTPTPGVTFDQFRADSILFQSGGILNATAVGGTVVNDYPVITTVKPITGGLQTFNIPGNCTPISSSTQYILQCR